MSKMFEWDFSELYKFAEELTSGEKTEVYLKKAMREVAKEIVDVIKKHTPVGETTQLIHGWDKRKITVKRTAEGYEVLLVNDVPYATAVNDGHMAYNQYGGPYPIKQENRKLQAPYGMYQGESDMYVYGHFFVEKGIIEYSSYGALEKRIMENLEKWWNNV